MNRPHRPLGIIATAFIVTLSPGSMASAQTSASQSPRETAPAPHDASQSRRSATTTFFGDTGLWFVPTAEVLGHGQWSVSGYRRGTNYVQGFQNIGDFAGTFSVGIRERAEVFGSFLFITRVERDLRPLFDPTNSDVGGIIDRHPRSVGYWSGNRVGDLYLGTKVNLLSESRRSPAAVALRGVVKAPTGKEDIGASTGKADFSLDVVASKEVARTLDLSGYAGGEFRGQPDGIEIPNRGFRWGVGAGFPSRQPLRIALEADGAAMNRDTATIAGTTIAGIDGSMPPPVSAAPNLTRATAAVTWQNRRGLFVGVGGGWNFPTRDRARFQTDDNARGDFVDWQVRFGFHPGVRTFVPPPPPPPPPVVANRPPTVTAQCEPCTVEVGGMSTVTATATDPDGDPLTYRWTAPTGVPSNPTARQTVWTAPQQEGSVPVTVTVDDGRGGTASASVTIQVVRPAVRTYTFEDVHFDFDRYSLRPDALRVLDEAVGALQQNPTMRIQIEGHTCNIGTAEYNLALGDRRANAVREYLVSRGISADRLRTVSYGEERPKYDNSREETRRLNRRAALVVNLQQ